MNPYEVSLTPDEFDRRLELARSDANEQAERVALIAWFMRRYPTARERLAYARRKAREWQRPVVGHAASASCEASILRPR